MYYQNPTQSRQNFYEIKANCQRFGTLFEDPEFPPNNSSLFVHGVDRRSNRGTIVWKRPFELVSRPKFYADGVSRFDVIQGELGNCWFIAAVSNLTLHQNLFEQVVARDNTFEQGHYCGAFHFRFWSFGHWTEVVVDDRLPCNQRGELLFMQSEDKTEFWSCLLEKAYAKFHGSYESLSGGIPSEALQDFSGGIVEIIDIRENQNTRTELYDVMKKAHSRQSLMTCALHNRHGSVREERTNLGLVRGHAYSITAVQEIPLYRGVQLVQLLRLRNPWGEFEWNGAWSDRSGEWGMVDNAIKSRVQLMKKNDGEFWMSVEDFENHFHRLEICHISPDPVSECDVKLFGQQPPWKRMVFEGSWIPGRSAGGCLNYSTFATNPQFFFDFEASDVDGDAEKCTVIVSLIQKTENRTFTRKEGLGKFCIGFKIFKVRQYTGLLGMDFFKRETSTWGSGAYTNSREISARFELRTGTYCIVPSTFEPDMGGNFLLRTFSEPPPPHKERRPVYNSNQQWATFNQPSGQYPPPLPPQNYQMPGPGPILPMPPIHGQYPPQFPMPMVQGSQYVYPPPAPPQQSVQPQNLQYSAPIAPPNMPTGTPNPNYGWNL